MPSKPKWKEGDRFRDKLAVMQGDTGTYFMTDRTRRPHMALVRYDGETRKEWIYEHEMEKIEAT